MICISKIEFLRKGTLIYTFTYSCDITIVKTWENLTQTAVITIPNLFKSRNKEITKEVKKGDNVKITLGYIYNTSTKSEIKSELIFEGYVTSLEMGYICKIHCEDEMYNFKKFVIDTPFTIPKGNNMKQVIDIVRKKFNYDFKMEISDTTDLGVVQITEGNSFADIVDFLAQKYRFIAFFRDNIFYMQKFSFTTGKKVKFEMQENIINGDTLEFQRAEDQFQSIKGDLIKPASEKGKPDEHIYWYCFYNEKGEVMHTKFPKSGFSQRQVSYQNIDESQMKINIEAELTGTTYTGYKGSFETFGRPVMNFGDKALIKDLRFPDYADGIDTDGFGSYLIKGVTTNYNPTSTGYTQTIELYGRG